MTDRLRNLLHQADDAASDAPLRADLAPRIRRRARQRRARRVLVAAVGISSITIFALLIVSHSSRPPQPNFANNTPIPAPPAKNSTNPLPSATAPLDPYTIDPVADLRDDAACTMVVIARRRARTLGPADAAEVYHRTIELYPESPWAVIARNELTNLPNRKEPL